MMKKKLMSREISADEQTDLAIKLTRQMHDWGYDDYDIAAILPIVVRGISVALAKSFEKAGIEVVFDSSEEH